MFLWCASFPHLIYPIKACIGESNTSCRHEHESKNQSFLHFSLRWMHFRFSVMCEVAIMHAVKLHLYFESHSNAVGLHMQAKPKLCMDCSLVNAYYTGLPFTHGNRMWTCVYMGFVLPVYGACIYTLLSIAEDQIELLAGLEYTIWNSNLTSTLYDNAIWNLRRWL